MKRIVQLKPHEALACPFCGVQPHIEKWHGGGAGKRVVSCYSETCHVNPMTSGGSRRVALKRWNLREDTDHHFEPRPR